MINVTGIQVTLLYPQNVYILLFWHIATVTASENTKAEEATALETVTRRLVNTQHTEKTWCVR
jgi:hypothetical protein